MAMKVACGNGFPLNIPSEIPTGGGGGGTGDYSDLTNKPKINDVTLSGNKSLSDIGAAAAADVSDIQDLIPSDASSTNKLATADDLPGSATTSAPGLVQPDGTSITINNGVISAVGGGSGETYSTTESTIGTWKGQTLYRKVIEFGTLPNSTSKEVDTGLPVSTKIVNTCTIARNTEGVNIPLPFVSAAGTSVINVRFTPRAVNIVAEIQDNFDATQYTECDIIVEYIKTT